jgi:DNA-binding MarR family transcriptional regulator
MKEQKWWLVVEAIESPEESGLIPYGLAMKYKNYAKLKKVVWKWYKKHLGRTDIKGREKLVLYALCERYSAQDYSSHDAVSYLALMIGMNRHTVSKGIQNLMDQNIIWCAIDKEKKVLRNLKAGVQHKHFLFVGLGVMLERESQDE